MELIDRKSATMQVQVPGQNGFALILVPSCHGLGVLFHVPRQLSKLFADQKLEKRG